MSAVLQLPLLWAQASSALQPQLLASAVHHIQRRLPKPEPQAEPQR